MQSENVDELFIHFNRGEYDESNEEWENEEWENEEEVDNDEVVIESQEETNVEWEDDGNNSEIMFNSDAERMVVSSCDKDDPQYPKFNEITHIDDP